MHGEGNAVFYVVFGDKNGYKAIFMANVASLDHRLIYVALLE
jgi:hypothetical protein